MSEMDKFSEEIIEVVSQDSVNRFLESLTISEKVKAKLISVDKDWCSWLASKDDKEVFKYSYEGFYMNESRTMKQHLEILKLSNKFPINKEGFNSP